VVPERAWHQTIARGKPRNLRKAQGGILGPIKRNQLSIHFGNMVGGCLNNHPMNIKQFLSQIGSKGGKSKSCAKLAAARANGRLGGRPKTKKKR